MHIRVLFRVACVDFFSVFPFSSIHSCVSRANVTRGLSLSPSLSTVASGSYSGACCLLSRRALPGPKEYGLPSIIYPIQDPRGPASLLRIRADFRDTELATSSFGSRLSFPYRQVIPRFLVALSRSTRFLPRIHLPEILGLRSLGICAPN